MKLRKPRARERASWSLECSDSTAALVVQAQGRSGLTPYARWGNVLALLIAVGACLAGLRRRGS